MRHSMFTLPLIVCVAVSLVFLECKDGHKALVPAKQVAPMAYLFDYARDAAPILTTDSTWMADGVTVRDARFSSCSSKHGMVKAYIVRPSGSGPFAGILFFHWLGRPKGNREEFLDEAIAFAREGVVSVLIQGYFPWIEDPVSGPVDRQQVIDQTIDARRALEIVLHEPGIDTTRIAYVGHDYGAMFGAIISGIESRISSYVLVAGMGNFGDWSLKYWPETAKGGEQAYRDTLDAVDPIHFIEHASPASLLFQFATNDKYITKETAMAFSGAASTTKDVRWYATTHDMNTPETAGDRRDWLRKELKLPKP